MIELLDRAEKYASGKTSAMIDKAIAQAYADGYRDGYKDHENEIPVDVRDGNTEYVDLGLPSGTLWSSDYEKSGDDTVYIALTDATKYNLPTREQCIELYKYCRLKDVGNQVYCIGPNGKSILFSPTGYKEIGSEVTLPNPLSYFWIHYEEGNTDNAAVLGYNRGIWRDTREVFSGYKLPIRLVKTK